MAFFFPFSLFLFSELCGGLSVPFAFLPPLFQHSFYVSLVFDEGKKRKPERNGGVSGTKRLFLPSCTSCTLCSLHASERAQYNRDQFQRRDLRETWSSVLFKLKHRTAAAAKFKQLNWKLFAGLHLPVLTDEKTSEKRIVILHIYS